MKRIPKQPENHSSAQCPDYGNWVPTSFLKSGYIVLAALFASAVFCTFVWKNRIASYLFLLAFLTWLAMCLYMRACSKAFSFEGETKVMKKIHHFVVSKLPWDGNGRLLDIGCGSGALTICCAKAFPDAQITGIDYWGKEWDYAKAQCERNARIEGVKPIVFQKGDAAKLAFRDEAFDAAVSNFVFHEVKTEPDKRKVVKEALRVVKKGGAFAFHDLFEQKLLYGDMEAFINQLKAEGITEIHYEPHTEKQPFIPGFVTIAPWMLHGLGILYGIK